MPYGISLKCLNETASPVFKLWDEAAGGSAFALTTLAAYLGGARDGDPVSAYAISRVVEMRGDYRQALGRDVLLRKPLSPIQRLEAEAQAQKMFSALRDAREKRFGKGNAVDPRPMHSD